MTNRITTLFLAFLFLTFFACSSESNQAVMGKWQGVSWKVGGVDSGRNAAEVTFEFNADNSYSAAFGQQKEEGAFHLTNNKLYTTAKGKAEKMVEVHLQGLDTLVMDMNRVGTMEQLVLVKK